MLLQIVKSEAEIDAASIIRSFFTMLYTYTRSIPQFLEVPKSRGRSNILIIIINQYKIKKLERKKNSNSKNDG